MSEQACILYLISAVGEYAYFYIKGSKETCALLAEIVARYYQNKIERKQKVALVVVLKKFRR